jgi:hypothetical protein
VKIEEIKLPAPRPLASLGTLDDRATFLTPVPYAAAFRRCQLVELVALGATDLETFRAKTVSQFLAGDGQMAVPAPECRLAFGQ